MKPNKVYSKRELDREYEAWARFLYKQYKKDKLKEKFNKDKQMVENGGNYDYKAKGTQKAVSPSRVVADHQETAL